MFHRRLEAAHRVHEGTCTWILSHQTYTAWLNEAHGLLWVKGNPGAGKSTVMAYLYGTYLNLQAQTNDIVLSFFFNARGSLLQQNETGMFRSLLHQVFKSSAAVRETIRSAFEDSSDVLHVNELRNLFTNAILQASKLHRMTIFIDALDEAGAGVARDLADYFYELDNLLVTKGGAAKICISCRQYPVVARTVRYDIWVNREKHMDTGLYTKAKLLPSTANQMGHTLTEKHCKVLQHDIVQRSLGIFQWVSLMVGIVIHRSDEGDSFPSMQKRLNDVPPDLDGLYKHILENLIDSQNHATTFLLMQWVAFAERPLSVEELRYGMASDGDSTYGANEMFVNGEDPMTASRRMNAFINSRSGALVEVNTHFDNTGKPDRGVQTVQFIHESVRGYLLEHGLKFLRGIANNDTIKTMIGDSHNRLLVSCLGYMKRPDVISHVDAQCNRNMGGKPFGGSANVSAMKDRLPFIDYASKGWIFHGKQAEEHGISPRDLGEQFGFPSQDALRTWWEMFKEVHFDYANFKTLYGDFLSVNNSPVLTRVAKFLVQNAMFLPTELMSTKKHFIFSNYDEAPLLHAVHWHHEQLVSCLIDEANVKVDKLTEYGSSAVDFAAYFGLKDILELLLLGLKRQNFTENASRKAKFNTQTFEVVVELLLDWGRSVEPKRNLRKHLPEMSRPYKTKVASDNTPLLDFKGVYPGSGPAGWSSCRGIGNALRSAVSLRDIKSTHLLLDWGADPNASGGDCGTALMDAATVGDTSCQIIQLLVEYGANVNGICQVHEGQHKCEDMVVSWHTPLQYAASQDRLGIDIVELLVQHGADPNAIDKQTKNNALDAAVSQGEDAEEVIRFLINNGVNVKTHNCHLLAHAVKVAEKGTVVELLLNSGSVINNNASYAHSSHAPWSPHMEDSWKYDCATCKLSPLSVAAARGDSCKHLVQLLLSHGADANAYEPHYGGKHGSLEFHHSPLNAALYNGDDSKEILKMLLDAGANFDIVNQGRALNQGTFPSLTVNAIGDKAEEVLKNLRDAVANFNIVHQGGVSNGGAFPSFPAQRKRTYDHIDILSWVLSPTQRCKVVRETVRILRKAGIALRFDGVLKPLPDECGRMEWFKEMGKKAQIELFREAGFFDHLDDKDLGRGESGIAPAWNMEEVQLELEKGYASTSGSISPLVASEPEDDFADLDKYLDNF